MVTCQAPSIDTVACRDLPCGMPSRAGVAFVALLSLLLPASAAATPLPAGQITEFSDGLNAGAAPAGIGPGPDGNVWFADGVPSKAVGRITPAGAIAEYSSGLPASTAPTDVAPGPDGNVWFTDQTAPGIGTITPSGSINPE